MKYVNISPRNEQFAGYPLQTNNLSPERNRSVRWILLFILFFLYNLMLCLKGQ